MKKKIQTAWLALGITAMTALPAIAASSNKATADPVTVTTGQAKAEIMVGVESWSGDNTYQIGYPVHWFDGVVENGYFPFSQLEFPLDIYMITARGNAEFHDTWMFSAAVKKDISSPDDQMIDQDWLTASNPGRLDVYSNSNVSEFEGYEFDLNAKYKFLRGDNWSLNAGLGYIYQNWQYTANLVQQYSPSGQTGYDYLGDGTPGISYKLEYNIPYIQIGGKVNLAKQFSVESNISYSPLVDAKDVDQHLLREKVNRGDLDGSAWMFNIKGKYDFNEHWFMAASYDFKRMETDGTMSAEFSNTYLYVYGVIPNHTVYEELESTQHALALNMGYSF
ncbi:MAG: omptin family outer membrane protease [Desulfocapsaceae bacterium]|nr:omptin family outer membrane protease [Desulfocapsaceae bacterium]